MGSRIPIVLDNIVFSLQKMGGASVYWGHLLEDVQSDPDFDVTIVERTEARENFIRKNLDITAPLKLQDKTPRRIAQFSRVDATRDGALFHSSCYRLAKRGRCTNITTVHDYIWAYYTSGLNRKIHMGQIRAAVLGSEGIICVSESTKRDLLTFTPEAQDKEICVIHQGYDDASYFFKNLPKRDQVIFVGSRTAAYKNFFRSVEAVSLLSEVMLLVAGPPLTKKERSFLELKLPGRYKVEVFPSSGKLCELLNQSIALLYLSEYEGFGIPVLEGMASGTPVIATRRSSIPEVAGRAGILLEDNSAENVAHEIAKLVEDEDYRTSKIQAGLSRAQEFSWEKTTRETKEFYKNIYNRTNG